MGPAARHARYVTRIRVFTLRTLDLPEQRPATTHIEVEILTVTTENYLCTKYDNKMAVRKGNGWKVW